MSDAPSRLPQPVRRVLLYFTAFTTLPFWLPAVRGLFDGPTYEWNLFAFEGRGVGGDYWFVALGSVFWIGVQLYAWRGERLAARFVIAVWFLLLTAGAVYIGLENPQEFRFRGDTLGVDISLVWIGPILFGLAAALSIWWILDAVHGGAKRSPPPWARGNFVWLAILILLLPIQFYLLRHGEPHGLTDRIGVALVILQWLLLGRAFRARKVRN